MKTIIYIFLFLSAGILITGTCLAQSANNNSVPFKEIHQKQCTDNFTAREIKKKELEITPTQIPLPNFPASRPGKKTTIEKRKRSAFNYLSSVYMPLNFLDSRSCCIGFSSFCASSLNFSDRPSAALNAPVEI